MNNMNVSNPLSLIALFASLAESIALGILPFSEHLTDCQIWVIIAFAVSFPIGMAAIFWYVLINKHEILFSPDEHGKGNYAKNVLEPKLDKAASTIAGKRKNAHENGRIMEFDAKIKLFLEEYGLEDMDAMTFTLDSSSSEARKEFLKQLPQLEAKS